MADYVPVRSCEDSHSDNLRFAGQEGVLPGWRRDHIHNCAELEERRHQGFLEGTGSHLDQVRGTCDDGTRPGDETHVHSGQYP